MSAVSDKVLSIATKFLGPASGVFLERQTAGHMNGLKFEDVHYEHLPELFKWVKLSSRHYIGDRSDDLVLKLSHAFNVKPND